MTVLKTVALENRVSAGIMRESRLRQSSVVTGEMGPITNSGFVAVVAIVVAGSAAVLGIMASASQQPLLLTLMAVLVMFGLFFLLAVAAGHIRLTERVTDWEFARSVAAGLDQGVLVTAKSSDLVYCNSAWEGIVGRGVSGTLRTLDQLVAGETAASESLFRLTRAAAEQKRHREEIRLPSAGSETGRWYEISVGPLVVPGKTVETGPLAMWVVADIDEEHRRHADRIGSLEGQIASYDALPIGQLSFAADGTLRGMNPTLVRWLGVSASAPRAARLSDLMSEDSSQLLRALIHPSPVGSDRHVDVDFIREDGRRLPVTVLARASSGEATEAVSVAVVTREPEKVSEPAGKTEPRFARLFQAAPFGIATISADGRIASANTAFARLLLETGKLEGRHLSEIVDQALDGEQRTAAGATIAQALAGQAVVPPIEVPVGPQGEFTRRLYLSSLSQAEGAREAAVLFLIDVTEQKSLEIKFAQSQKMEAVGKLAGGIAHDFNNVLTAIIGFSDLLLQTHRPTDPAYKDIINIKSSANRAAGMVLQLLAFSRRQTLQAEVLQLHEVITDLYALLTRAISEKVELKIPAPRDLWAVKADKTQFEQVIINLAVNAGDAMPDGGVLSIRTRNINERESQRIGGGLVAGEYVLIEVEDTGTGMSPEVMGKIFEPFFTTKAVGKGTGLGLATVYGIVKQTGGFIYPESTPGKGTVFRVYLPRHNVAVEDVAVPAAEDAAAAGKGKRKDRGTDLTGTGRVLLVEDEDTVRTVAMRALTRQGYEVFAASNGVEALELMEQAGGKFDIVVSDVVMPEMDGPSLLVHVRKRQPGMKFIFMSGYPDDAFKRNLDDDTPFAFLQKPFSLPQLAQKVKEELSR
jgi:two-component system cell cycle sensor histidine kinase/response regulator CckA